MELDNKAEGCTLPQRHLLAARSLRTAHVRRTYLFVLVTKDPTDHRQCGYDASFQNTQPLQTITGSGTAGVHACIKHTKQECSFILRPTLAPK